MGVVRNVIGVIVGYLIFAVSAVLLFAASGVDPHADASIGSIALVIVYGAFFAFAGGYVCKLIAASGKMTVNIVLAALMAGFAAFSFLRSPGSHYTQIAAIFVFAPVSLLGGFTRASRK